MRHAIALGGRGVGRTAENPSVGAVLVKDGRIIGRGRTADGGRPHAEPVAIAAAGQGAQGATLYVTLEPCAHVGQTGPCAEAIVAADISRVVIAVPDPDPRVAGRGVAILKAAGIDVIEGVLRQEAEEGLWGFLYRITRGRPYVTLKTATSLDGKMALSNGESQWITGASARRHVHLERARADAILVGKGTVLIDNPSLTCRLSGLERYSPTRIILDARAETPVNAALFQDPVPIWIVIEKGAEPGRCKALSKVGASLIEVNNINDIKTVLSVIAAWGVGRLIVEGGARVHGSFMASGCVDAVDHYSAGKIIGGDGLSSIGSLGLSKLDDAPIFTPRFVRRMGPDWFTHFTKTE